MAVVTEPTRLTGLLKYELDPSYCREEVTVLAGSGAERHLALGTVVGRVTASGKVVALDLAASDGSETVAGVLLSTTAAPDGVDATGIALVRGPAIVADHALVYPAGATTPQKTTINTALAGLGVVVRTGV